MKEIKDLKETVELMNSEDYKERFEAEFYQLKIRKEKLKEFIDKYENGELNFEPSCSVELLKSQYSIMTMYLDTLIERARIEDIELMED